MVRLTAPILSLLCLIVGLAGPAYGFGPSTLESGSTAYQEAIGARFGDAGGPVQAELFETRGLLHLERKQGAAAVDALERAIAAGRDSAANWTALAEAWALIEGSDARRLDSLYAALAASTERSARIALLDRLADAFVDASRPRDAIFVLRDRLAIGDDEERRKQLDGLIARDGFRVYTVDPQVDRPAPRLCFTFSLDLGSSRDIRYGDFVRVSPPGAYDVTASGSNLCVEGLRHGRDYRVSLLAGLPSGDGDWLWTPYDWSGNIGDRPSSVAFRSSSYILPMKGADGIPVETVNLSDLSLTLNRIDDRNLATELRNGRLDRLVDGYDLNSIAEDDGERLWSGEMMVDSTLNERVRSIVPLETILPDPVPGLYLLTAFDASRDTEAEIWSNRATQWFVVTDIGLATFTGADGLTVATRSLADGGGRPDVTLKLIARNNKVLGEATSGPDGLARFPGGLIRGTGGNQPQLVTAYAEGGDFTYLDLSRPAFDLSDRGVSGRAEPGPLDAFIYTDRGVYRRGGTVAASILLRNQRADAVGGLPLTLRLLRPDGMEQRRITVSDGGMGGYEARLPIPAAAQTGMWTLFAHADPEADPIGTLRFLVEDVVPATVEVALATEAKALTSNGPISVTASADFLYGAPAADLRAEMELVIQADDTPFPAFDGYRFGLADEEILPVRREIGTFRTDAEGRLEFDVATGPLPDVTLPLKAVVRGSIFEISGRPVNAALTLPIHDKPFHIGIRPPVGGEVPQNSIARIEVIAVDETGNRVSRGGLRYELVRERWDYDWFLQGGAWDYRISIRDEPVTGGEVDITADRPTRVEAAVDWGRYRLEVYDPTTGVASSIRFGAGWFVAPQSGDTPDTMEVVLDKDSYLPGETAKAHLRAPFAGRALVAIATDRIVATYDVALGADGTTIEIPVTDDWGVGAYVLATGFRPDGDQHGPGRAIGLAWAPIDAAPRTLEVAIQAPDEILPRQTVSIPVSVTGVSGGEAYLTLAAVDEGILQLTRFDSPDPEGFFFGKRRLGLDIRDAYGRLIDAKGGRRGQIRSGGDAGGLDNGAPEVDVQMLALFSGIVRLDADGKAEVPLDIPAFNGRLRLMAVAWDRTRVGSGSTPLPVREPLIAKLATPRFLAPGDDSRMTVSLDNLSAPAGGYNVLVEVSGEARLIGAAEAKVNLEPGHRTALSFDLEASEVGRAEIAVAITGPDRKTVRLDRFIDIRPAQLRDQELVIGRLSPGESFQLPPDIADRYIPGTAEALIGFNTVPSLDVPGLLRDLDLYPYGCLEQTTSRALPLLYYGVVARLWDAPGTAENADLARRIDGAVERVLGMQRPDGAFSLWSARGPAELWLSGYAMDFLTRASAAGHEIPGTGYTAGLDWLARNVQLWESGTDIPANTVAYAHYVLAAAGQSRPSHLRYMADHGLEQLDAIGAAQLGAALALNGETQRAQSVFLAARALLEKEAADGGSNSDYASYGSPLRNLAALLALAGETEILPADVLQLVRSLADQLASSRYTSTQEKAWTLLAANGLAQGSGLMRLEIEGSDLEPTRQPVYRRLGDAALAQGFHAVNRGADPIWRSVTLAGVPSQPLPPIADGFSISRGFYRADGSPLDLGAVDRSELIVVLIEGEAQEPIRQRALVVDLLPAGLELENARLADSRSTGDFAWLPELTQPRHSEMRDDRFVAAIDLEPDGRSFRLAYLARAVTPGRYSVPAVHVEDMYKPYLRGRNEMGEMRIVGR